MYQHNNYVHYRCNIFERALPILDIQPTNTLHKLSLQKFKKPMPIIIECLCEEDTITNISKPTQLKSILLASIYILICCATYML
jgi:hypothetical protein